MQGNNTLNVSVFQGHGPQYVSDASLFDPLLMNLPAIVAGLSGLNARMGSDILEHISVQTHTHIHTKAHTSTYENLVEGMCA